MTTKQITVDDNGMGACSSELVYLPTYTPSGEKAAAGRYSAVEVWRINHTRGWSDLRTEEYDTYVNSNATTRRIYRTTPAETKPVEKGKTAEDILDGYTGNWQEIKGVTKVVILKAMKDWADICIKNNNHGKQ